MVPRVVPWRDWAEWNEVRCGLMGTDSQRAAQAISRVRAWQSRGKVPHSVEATAALVEIISTSKHIGTGARSVGSWAPSDNELRLMYSMALVRLVNGIVDAVQQKKFASPVSDLAGQVALPRILVDIRHTASHNALPSLPALSLAADRALQWLQQHYWDPQAAVVLTPPADTVVPLLRKYVRVRSKMLAAAQREEEEGKEGDSHSGVKSPVEGPAKGDKRLKREAAASELLASILASTPALDVSHALVEPIITTSAYILAETLQDLGLQHFHRDAPGAHRQNDSQLSGPGVRNGSHGEAGSGDTANSSKSAFGKEGPTLSQREEALQECAKYVIRIWHDAMDDFEAMIPGFRATLRAGVLRRLHDCSIAGQTPVSTSMCIQSSLTERSSSAGENSSEAARGSCGGGGNDMGRGGVVVERGSWLCLLATWLMDLRSRAHDLDPACCWVSGPQNGGSAAGKESTVGQDDLGRMDVQNREKISMSGWQASQEQRDIVRLCLSAPSVWTRQLLHTAIPQAGGMFASRKRSRATEAAGAAVSGPAADRVRIYLWSTSGPS